MKLEINQPKRGQSGFSLIELVVVMTIVGILTMLGLPQITEYIAKARRAEVQTQLSQIHSAQKAYHTANRSYFTNLLIVGWRPEGQLNYVYGFSAAGGTPPPDITPAPLGTANINTTLFCGANRAGMTAAQLCHHTTLTSPPAVLATATATAPKVAPPAATDVPATVTANANGFRLTASSEIAVGGLPDRWSIDSLNRMAHLQSGLRSGN